jgi:hypothetical protein
MSFTIEYSRNFDFFKQNLAKWCQSWLKITFQFGEINWKDLDLEEEFEEFEYSFEQDEVVNI